jgi:midasin
MERVAVAISLAEPVLLVGETGTGKTTLVQQIAKQVGVPARALACGGRLTAGRWQVDGSLASTIFAHP